MDKEAAAQYAGDTVYWDAFISLLAAETLRFLYSCHVRLVSRCKSCLTVNPQHFTVPSLRTWMHVICMTFDAC